MVTRNTRKSSPSTVWKAKTQKSCGKKFFLRDLDMEAGNTSEAKVVIFTASDGLTTYMPLDYFFNNDNPGVQDERLGHSVRTRLSVPAGR